METVGKAKAVCESRNKPRYGQTLGCFTLTLPGLGSWLFIIKTYGEVGMVVAVGTSAGVSEASGMRVSVGILDMVSVAAAVRVLAPVLVGMITPGEVG